MKKILGRTLLALALLSGLLILGALAAEAEPAALLSPAVPDFSVSDPGTDYPDNDARFEMYFNELSFGKKTTYDLMGYGADILTGANRDLYNTMIPGIQAIARGDTTSTVVKIPFANMSRSYTYTVGITASSDIQLTGYIYPLRNSSTGALYLRSDEENILKLGAASMFFGELNLMDIHAHLLADCPADLYWYDKTKGFALQMQGEYPVAGITWETDSRGAVSQVTLTELSFAFVVASDYRASSSNAYVVNASKINTAKTAIANAQTYVDKYAAATDYAKLTGYRDEICALVSYDHATLAQSEAGVDVGTSIWQLVYVFDKNPSTNVVCEGYAKAFQYLCDLTVAQGLFHRRVECYPVMGNLKAVRVSDNAVTTNGGHMWNVIRVGWKSFLVDVTNSDAGTTGNNDLFLKGGTPSGSNRNLYAWVVGGSRISYEYFDGSVTGTFDQRAMYGDTLTLAALDYAPPQAGEPDYYWYSDKDTAFTLTTPEELAGLALMLKNGDRDFYGKRITLGADLNLSAFDWEDYAGASSAFKGAFDGAGHTLRGLSGSCLFSRVGAGGSVRNLITVVGCVCDQNSGIVADCLAQGSEVCVVKVNAGSVQNCCTTSSTVIVTNNASNGVSNCYYLSDEATSAIRGTYPMTADQFLSGEVAWWLQYSRTAPVWGQDIGTGTFPVPTSDAALGVCQVTFLTAATHPEEAWKTLYVNTGSTVPLPQPPEKAGYRFEKWVRTNSVTGVAFTADTVVTRDCNVYAVLRSLFGAAGEGASLSAVYGKVSTPLDLSTWMAYPSGETAAGQFTYTLTAAQGDGGTVDPDTLVQVEGDTLSVLQTAPAGDYTLTLTAAEKAPHYSLFDLAAPDTQDVTLTVSLSIAQAPATLTVVPAVLENLTYTGQPQALLTAGETACGTLVYSLDGESYAEAIPTGQNAGSYPLWYKVLGDANHTDTEAVALETAIAPWSITASEANTRLAAGPFVYDSLPKTPAVLVILGGSAGVIPAEEYTVSYENNVNAGQAGVIIGNAPGGNYAVTGTVPFTIHPSDAQVTVQADRPGNVYYYGDEIVLTVAFRFTGTASLMELGAAPTPPTAGQIAIFDGDSQLTPAQDASSGDSLTFRLDTAAMAPGRRRLTARYVASDNISAGEATVDVTIRRATLAGAPTWDGQQTTLSLSPQPDDLLDACALAVAARYDDQKTMVSLAVGALDGNALTFPADLTQPGWRLFLLDGGCVPLCRPIPLDEG